MLHSIAFAVTNTDNIEDALWNLRQNEQALSYYLSAVYSVLQKEIQDVVNNPTRKYLAPEAVHLRHLWEAQEMFRKERAKRVGYAHIPVAYRHTTILTWEAILKDEYRSLREDAVIAAIALGQNTLPQPSEVFIATHKDGFELELVNFKFLPEAFDKKLEKEHNKVKDMTQRGFGDTLADLFKWMGFKKEKCSRCARWAQAFNLLWPYKIKKPV